jgi:hypothetical protein
MNDFADVNAQVTDGNLIDAKTVAELRDEIWKDIPAFLISFWIH